MFIGHAIVEPFSVVNPFETCFGGMFISVLRGGWLPLYLQNAENGNGNKAGLLAAQQEAGKRQGVTYSVGIHSALNNCRSPG